MGLKGVVEGRYLFGAPMSRKAVRWTYSKTPQYDVPAAIAERLPDEKWVLVDEESEERPVPAILQTKEETLDGQGRLILDLATDLRAGRPHLYTLEADVTDVSRQTIAGRASFRVDPAPWYVGVKRPAFFADARAGLDTEIVVGLTEQATIVAPISGRTGALMVHEGNLVRANDAAPLVVINQVSPIYVSFGVPEGQFEDLTRDGFRDGEPRGIDPPLPASLEHAVGISGEELIAVRLGR